MPEDTPVFRQYMTKKQGDRPVFAVTIREFPTGRRVDALSSSISVQWFWEYASETIIVLQAVIDHYVDPHEHFNQALGYLEYLARFKWCVPCIIVDKAIFVDVLERRGYVEENGRWHKRVYHTP